MVDMTIKLCPSTNPITIQHIQLSYMFVNNKIPILHVSLDISTTLVDMCIKLHKYLGFDGQKCTHVFNFCKQCSLGVNSNNSLP